MAAMVSHGLAPNIEETAARIVRVREALGLSKADFANSIEVDRSSWTKIELGKKPLHADHAFRISVRYGVPMDYLYRGVLRDLPESIAVALRRA
jgi:transcriptional regulator with XRE-family HTH domain